MKYSYTYKSATKPKRTVKAELRKIYKEADAIELEMKKHILSEFRAMQDSVELGEIEDALSSAKMADIFKAIDATGFKATFAGLGDIGLEGAITGAVISLESLGIKYSIDKARPIIQRRLKEHMKQFIDEAVRVSKDAVKTVVTDGIDRGRHPTKIAKDIRESIGLTDRDAGAVSKRRDWLLGQGKDAATADDMASAYSESLINQRAETIARTEAMNAIGAGRAGLWESMVKDGTMPEDQLQEWDATRDGAVCNRCAAMHGKTAPIGGTWDAPDVGAIAIPNQIHPSCRCCALLKRPK